MQRATRYVGLLKVCLGAVVGATLMSLSPWATGDLQPVVQSPIGEKFWPSEFGPDDQRGATNRITAAKVVDATRLIKSGQIYQLGRLYEHGMPLPGKRHFSLTIPGLPTGPPSGSNRIVSNDELVSGEIGQVGTQFADRQFEEPADPIDPVVDQLPAQAIVDKMLAQGLERHRSEFRCDVVAVQSAERPQRVFHAGELLRGLAFEGVIVQGEFAIPGDEFRDRQERPWFACRRGTRCASSSLVAWRARHSATTAW